MADNLNYTWPIYGDKLRPPYGVITNCQSTHQNQDAILVVSSQFTLRWQACRDLDARYRLQRRLQFFSKSRFR